MVSMGKRLAELLNELRALSHELIPRNLGDMSLVGPIRDLIEDFNEKANFQITFAERHIPAKLPPAIMIALFRLLQESLSNITKHADASHVSVTLTGHEQGIELTVKDDGIGFDPDILSIRRKSVGIIGMKERLRLLGGTIKIISQPCQGTMVVFSIPYPADIGRTPSSLQT
jgi:signal transduction histidine kinase